MEEDMEEILELNSPYEKEERDIPADCQSCEEEFFLDRFGNQRICSKCSLWEKSAVNA